VTIPLLKRTGSDGGGTTTFATVTVSAHVLLFSLLSDTCELGSTLHIVPVPVRGFTKEPATVPVVGTTIVIVPPAGIVTFAFALQVRVLLATEHPKLPVVPDVDVAITPYVAPVLGIVSVRIVFVFPNVADAEPVFVMVRVQLNGVPTVAFPETLFVLTTVKSGIVGATIVKEDTESGVLELFEESFTTIVQFECVPRARVLKAIVLLPVLADVSKLEQSPP
jgi:hypothetical protein